MTWTDGQIISRKSNISWQMVDDEALLISPDRPQAHELNTTGAWIWQQLEEEVTVEELATRMNIYFEVEADVAQRDISHFITELRDAGLINVGQ